MWLSFDYRRKKIELAKLERKLTGEADDLERGLVEIDVEQKRYEILCCEKVAEERAREIKQWDTLKKEQVEKGGVFTESADAGQLRSYTKTFILEMFNSGNNIGAAEAQNIIGKAVTAKNRCKELGIWQDIVKEMGLVPKQLEDLGE